MTQICPKCSYIRKANDTCPEWQCPACQVVYSKAGDILPSMSSRGGPAGTRQRAATGAASGTWKWLILIAIIAAVAWQGKRALPDNSAIKAQSGSTQISSQPEIILYGTTWCGYCDAAREFFKANGIAYTDLDTEKSTEGYEGYKKLGGGGVPLIVIGTKTMRGYNEAGLRQQLAPWMRGK